MEPVERGMWQLLDVVHVHVEMAKLRRTSERCRIDGLDLVRAQS